MKLLLSSLSTVLMLTGCTSTAPNGEQVPRYAGRIEVAIYDTTVRPPVKSLDVFDDAASVKRPYKIIALLSHESKPSDSGRMMNAIAFRARQLGADGMIVLPPRATGYQWNGYGGGPGQPIYSAQAIIFTDKP